MARTAKSNRNRARRHAKAAEAARGGDFVAKFSGTCPFCGAPFTAGDALRMVRGRSGHSECALGQVWMGREDSAERRRVLGHLDERDVPGYCTCGVIALICPDDPRPWRPVRSASRST